MPFASLFTEFVAGALSAAANGRRLVFMLTRAIHPNREPGARHDPVQRHRRYPQSPLLSLPHDLCGRIVLPINYLTSPGHGWFQWVAFGMGIGLLVAWVRALWGFGFAALTAGIACLVYRWLRRHQVAPAVKA